MLYSTFPQSTSVPQIIRRSVSFRRAALAAAALLAVSLPLGPALNVSYAQSRGWNAVVSASDEELYVRSLQLLGTLPQTGWASRPLANRTLDLARRELNESHPWQLRFSRDTSLKALSWRGVALDAGLNSAFPWGGNDGARWQGKGINGAVTTGGIFRWKFLTARVEPTFVFAQNRAFDPLPSVLGDSVGPYVDRMRPRTIDLPERLGSESLQRVDAGESELRAEAKGLAVTLSNRALFFGPAFRNSIILGANAPGIAHIAAGPTDGIRTPIGRLSGTIVYARLAQSAFAPEKREGARIGAGTVVSWRPPSGRGFEIGLIRFYHRDWPADGIEPRDLLLPFGSLLRDNEIDSVGVVAPDNQLLSVFARAASVSTGLEVFAEFARNDRASGVRDLTVEPEHNSAWSAGMLKVIGTRGAPTFWTARVEYLNGRITSLQRFRSQATFYEHFTITQGHTNRGQVLGSPLLERTGGFEIAVDRWSSRGRLGGLVQQRSMPFSGEESVVAGAARSQWALELNGSFLTRLTEYGWRTGVAWDLNRTPGNDVANVFLGGSIRLAR